MNKGEDSTVKEMVLLILCCGVFLQLVLLIFAKHRLFVSAGLWIGVMLAEFMLIYMYRILERGLGWQAKDAEKYVRMHSIVRYFSVVIVYGIVIFARLGDPLACFAGILSLKAAAYLQPLYVKYKKGKMKK